MPVRKASTRAGEAGLATGLSVLVMVPGEFERAGINLAAWPPRNFDRMCNSVLDAVARQPVAQEDVDLVRRQGLAAAPRVPRVCNPFRARACLTQTRPASRRAATVR